MNQLKIITILFLFFITIKNLNGQNQNVIDSLKNLLSKSKLDTTNINLLLKIGDLYIDKYPDSAFIFYQKGLDKSVEIKSKILSAKCYRKIGNTENDKSRALEYYLKSLEINKEINNKEGIADCYNNIGLQFANTKEINKALDYYNIALTLYTELNDRLKVSKCYFNLGSQYSKLEQDDKALDYFNKSLKIAEEIKDKNLMAACYHNLGTYQDSIEKAKDYYYKSIKLYTETGNNNGAANVYMTLGINLYNQKNYKKSFELLLKASQLQEIAGNKYGMMGTIGNISNFYFYQKDYSKATEYSLKGIEIAKELKDFNRLKTKYFSLSGIYNEINDFKNAYKYCKLSLEISDSLEKTDNLIKFQNIETQFQKKIKQREIELLKKDKELQSTEIKQQKTQKIAFLLGFMLLLFLIIFVLFSYKKMKSHKILIEKKNDILNQQNEEIRSQRDEIEAQKHEIESQRDTVINQKNHIEHIHKEQTDSIKYAESIQQAVLPVTENINLFVSEYFILFRPKDIVSGDFYWTSLRNNWLLIAVADCTGHGVPGAMMSMLGISFLNEIVARTDITDASQVLNELRNSVIKSLKQKGTEGERKDGMDISFIAINISENLLQYSGANNPLYIIKNGKNKELIEIKADKMPIGIYEEMTQFKNHKITINKGDSVYIFSDGFIDQFGGQNHKKFLSKRLKEILVTVNNYSMKEQKEKLLTIFDEWKGNSEQIDDVTIMGIKI